METLGRFFQAPDQSLFLFGPRGTGKSTWARSAFPDALILDLLEPVAYRRYAARPERLQELVAGSPDRKQVLIDEVQRVPALLPVVHALIEEKRGRQFILTGSSARKIRREGVDLLAGRALLRTLHPFMATELGEAFHLGDALKLGLVPLVVAAAHPKETLRGYVTLYIEEEVRTEGLVRSIGDFSRFLEAASLSHGTVLNVSCLARECEVDRKTVENYLSILEDLLLAFRIPVFSRRAKRKLVSHPKLYIFDAGVYGSLRPRGPLDRSEEVAGAGLEGLVAQHLRAWNAYRGDRDRLFYWRTQSGVEVDFVVYGETGLHAIEVTSSRRVDPADLRKLRAFAEDYPDSHLVLLYLGPERLKKDGIHCLPCEEFLKALHPHRILPGL